jgi:hypothetical protein
MSRLPFSDDQCHGCFLFQTRGRVCPMLDRQAQEAAEAERQAAALRAVVLQDAEVAVTLPELVHVDAACIGAGLTARPGLLAALAADLSSHDSRKEAIRVIPSRTAR